MCSRRNSGAVLTTRWLQDARAAFYANCAPTAVASCSPTAPNQAESPRHLERFPDAWRRVMVPLVKLGGAARSLEFDNAGSGLTSSRAVDAGVTREPGRSNPCVPPWWHGTMVALRITSTNTTSITLNSHHTQTHADSH